MKRIAILVTAPAVVVAACGGAVLSGEEQAIASELAAGIEDVEPEFLSYLSGDRVDLECWAERLVVDLGLPGRRGS